jgi:hypothetical protein
MTSEKLPSVIDPTPVASGQNFPGLPPSESCNSPARVRSQQNLTASVLGHGSPGVFGGQAVRLTEYLCPTANCSPRRSILAASASGRNR